jgi:cytochrome d ubiquinol oxidase subunit II
VDLVQPQDWLSPYCLANGLLALSTCAYLAAVYLTNESVGPLREDFRRRAILAGTATAALAGAEMWFAHRDASWFFQRLISARCAPIVFLGLICFAGSAWAVFTRRYRLSRFFAAAEIGLLLLGWGLAQYPYLIYPDVTFVSAAAPRATLQFVAAILPIGAVLILPALWLLMRVFKGAAKDRSAVSGETIS